MATVVYVQGDRPDNAIEVPFVEEEIPEGYWAVPVEIASRTTITWRSSPAWKRAPCLHTDAVRQHLGLTLWQS